MSFLLGVTSRWARGAVALSALVGCLAVGGAAPERAEAFCGFYVGGADQALYNNATQVVLMREGTKTILSMQNNYQGPLDDFAMVIPVPIVLQEDNVKTLDKELFDKIDLLSAPRLVEYWEMDPCAPDWNVNNGTVSVNNATSTNNGSTSGGGGVNVEAEFKVGEYEIVILSADDSSGLDTWLRSNDYNIPDEAEPVLRPYVEGGMYFFVARIISEEVTFDSEGRAVLSPLRFHYDNDTFSLPIRLGLLSAEDKQDLLVYILAQNQRYEVANYPNATIPTNINVVDEVRNDFGAFYNALFDRTLEQNPGAVVTEYAWDASTCDPCPGPTLDATDMATFGADILGIADNGGFRGGWTLTRLHARYGADDVGEDLVFDAASPIVGGREVRDRDGELETGSQQSSFNNFQGRYAIRHAWEGPVTCDDPVFGRWGGPPGGGWDEVAAPATSPNTSGDDFRTQSSGLSLEGSVAEPVPELGVNPEPGDTVGDGGNGGEGDGSASGGDNASGGGSGSSGGGCATAVGGVETSLSVLLLMGLVGLIRRRRRGER